MERAQPRPRQQVTRNDSTVVWERVQQDSRQTAGSSLSDSGEHSRTMSHNILQTDSLIRKGTSTKKTQEFQIVLLAGGRGNRLYPLTEGHSKYLLPVANRPLISYQLELLEHIGFNEVIIITDTESAPQLKRYVNELHAGKIRVIWEVCKPRSGTAEALLKIKDSITTKNFIVMSADLIVADAFLHSMADIHRTQNAALTILLKKEEENQEKEERRKNNEDVGDLIGLDCEDRLVYFTAKADLEEEMSFKKTILKRYHNVTMHSDLNDSHFYIFSRWVLDVLSSYSMKITSIKGELIPLLVKLQKRKKLLKGGIPDEVLHPISLTPDMASRSNLLRDNLGCFAYVMSDYCRRVNTISSYLEANQEIVKGNTTYMPLESPGKNNFIDKSSTVDAKTQIGPECIVGAGTVIGEKSSVKKSNIGKHCKIGNGVKIINSVIMDHVTIQDNCTIQNTILSSNVHMSNNCLIKDCEVGSSFSCKAKTSYKNESLIAEED